MRHTTNQEFPKGLRHWDMLKIAIITEHGRDQNATFKAKTGFQHKILRSQLKHNIIATYIFGFGRNPTGSFFPPSVHVQVLCFDWRSENTTHTKLDSARSIRNTNEVRFVKIFTIEKGVVKFHDFKIRVQIPHPNTTGGSLALPRGNWSASIHTACKLILQRLEVGVVCACILRIDR